MDSEPALLTLRRGLIEAVDESGRSRRELSAALSRGPGFLSRMLRGRGPMRVEEVLHLLSVLGVRPLEFFGDVFPLGGASMARVRRAFPPRPSLRSTLSLAELEAQGVHAQGGTLLSSVALAVQAGRLLALKIRQAERRQKEVAAALGLSAGALGRALNGSSELTFSHLFGVLAEIGVRPGRFFAELLGSQSPNPMEQVRWSWTLDWAERDLHRSMPKLARELGLEEGEPEGETEGEPEGETQPR